MRKLGIALVLSLALPAAVPANAANSYTGFATMERCERHLEHQQRQQDRQRAKGWAGVSDLIYGAYCEERDGRFFLVYFY